MTEVSPGSFSSTSFQARGEGCGEGGREGGANEDMEVGMGVVKGRGGKEDVEG